MKKVWLIVCSLVLLSAAIPRYLDAESNELIALAKQIKDQFASSYWSNWAEIPMAIILVGDEEESLINSPVKDTSFEYKSDSIGTRPVRFNKNLLATFPAVQNLPTIVVGTPKNTGKNKIDWVVTLLHEHFHQLQFSHTDYYTAQKALKLDNGDQTGMWIINYPFPYEDEKVNKILNQMAQNLIQTDSIGSEKVLKRHKSLKHGLRKQVGDQNYKYLNLQLWQEGYARYIEIELAKDWLNHFAEIQQDQFSKKELEELIATHESKIRAQLEKSSAKELKRVYFYALGSAEAKLIAATNEHWKQQYFNNLFTTDPLLK